jgi:hypothetical protein
MSSQPESWTIEHFALSNAAGPGQEDVPALLRAVADALERYGTVSVRDLVLHSHHEITEHGAWPSITVYFSRPPVRLVPPA